MPEFQNETQQKFWIDCIRHAEASANTKYIQARYQAPDYVEYADKMLSELLERSKGMVITNKLNPTS